MEVLVALVVAAVVLTGVLSAYAACIARAEATVVSMRSLSLLQEMVGRVRTGAAATYGTQEGELEEYPGFHWEIVWEDAALPGLERPVKKARISVSRSSPSGRTRPLMVEVLLDPR